MITQGRPWRRWTVFAAGLVFFLFSGGHLRAQGDIDDIDDLGDLHAVEAGKPGEKETASWRRWEAGFLAGRLALTGNAYSQDAFTAGFQVSYRFGSKAKGRDGIVREVQGRHGIEIGALAYETDYFADHSLFTDSDALPLHLKFGNIQMTFPNGWFAMQADGQYRYTVVSVNYIYSQLDKRFRLRKITPYYVAGVGYAFGSADVAISARVRQIACDPSDPACVNWDYVYGTIADSGGSGICNPSDPNYNDMLCDQASIAREFFRYEFRSAPTLHIGAGLRWQWKPKWVVNFEIRDHLVLYDDSHFPAPGGTDLNVYEFLQTEVYGHSFLVKVAILRNFNVGRKK